MFKKRSLTSTDVPFTGGASFTDFTAPLLTSISVPTDSPSLQVDNLTLETAAILGSASPLNPRVVIAFRSLIVFILLVACLSKHRTASSLVMPIPSSVTLIYLLPLPLISIVILPAHASIELSVSSLTTEAGLSTTSPAAIQLASSSGNFIILLLIIFSTPLSPLVLLQEISLHGLYGSEQSQQGTLKPQISPDMKIPLHHIV